MRLSVSALLPSLDCSMSSTRSDLLEWPLSPETEARFASFSAESEDVWSLLADVASSSSSSSLKTASWAAVDERGKERGRLKKHWSGFLFYTCIFMFGEGTVLALDLHRLHPSSLYGTLRSNTHTQEEKRKQKKRKQKHSLILKFYLHQILILWMGEGQM